MNAQTDMAVSAGLEGVVAAATHLSMVDGERGELVIAGLRLEQLAVRPFEEAVAELWDAAGVHGGPRVKAVPVPAPTIALLRAAAVQRMEPMDALRMAAGTLTASNDLDAAN